MLQQCEGQGVVWSTRTHFSWAARCSLSSWCQAEGLEAETAQYPHASAQTTIPPPGAFHCHAKVLLKGVPVADCLQSLTQGWWGLQLIWYSRMSREGCVEQIATFMDNTFQCFSAPRQFCSFPGHCMILIAVLKSSFTSWTERACSSPLPWSDRGPTSSYLCFFPFSHLSNLFHACTTYLRFSELFTSQKFSLLFFPLCQALSS